MELEDLQNIEDAYLAQLREQLANLSASGNWDWPAYEITDVSAVVVGHRHIPNPGGEEMVEAVYALTLTSAHPIPHAGDSKYEANSEGSFTFTQLGQSVFADADTGFKTLGISIYTGITPHAQPGKKGARKAGTPRPLDTGGSTKPHPPP